MNVTSVLVFVLIGIHGTVLGVSPEKWMQILDLIKNNASLKTDYQTRVYEQEQEMAKTVGITFPCVKGERPTAKPSSVHRLTPYDIDVIGAMGDSITAGTGIRALTVVGDLIAWRGLSWSVGGDGALSNLVTMPNFLRQYNPNIKGASTWFSQGFLSPVLSPFARCNEAIPGAKADDMETQAHDLVKSLKKASGDNFETDWKLITIFIGANDLCDYCYDHDKFSAASYKARIKKGLDVLFNNVPRVFVNLVEVVNVSIVREFNDGLVCNLVHWVGCECGGFPKNEQAMTDMKRAVEDYQKSLTEIVESGEYEREDFTLVVQPFLRHTVPPKKMVNGKEKVDLSYFAADCFHFSLKGQFAMAEALWNSMVEPVGKKRTNWYVGEPLECPKKDFPYFYTNKNSAEYLSGKSKSFGSQQEDYSQEIQSNLVDSNQVPDQTNQPSKLNGGAIVGVVVGAVLSMLLVAGVLLLRYRKSKRTEVNERKRLVSPNRYTEFE